MPRRSIFERDPRLPRIRGGKFGALNTKELDLLSAASVFFCHTGTHRAMYGERFTSASQVRALPSQPLPGPGAYKTVSTIGQADQTITDMKWNFHFRQPNQIDYSDGSRTRYHSSPAISFTKSTPLVNKWQTPSPVSNCPTSGYTSTS